MLQYIANEVSTSVYSKVEIKVKFNENTGGKGNVALEMCVCVPFWWRASMGSSLLHHTGSRPDC